MTVVESWVEQEYMTNIPLKRRYRISNDKSLREVWVSAYPRDKS